MPLPVATARPTTRTSAPAMPMSRPGEAGRGPGAPPPVVGRLANQHAELADAYAEAGALGRAIEQYERALELGPGFHDLRYRMARVMLEAGRPLEAREALETVLLARPNFVDAEAALGLAHFLSGDGVGARERGARQRLVARVAHRRDHGPRRGERSAGLRGLEGRVEHRVARPVRAREVLRAPH